MSCKKPINDLWMYREKEEFATVFNSKRFKKLLKDGYYISSMAELWFDSDQGLKFNNWIEEYVEGNWGMTQEEVERAVWYVVRKFSHLSRRSAQKVMPRAYNQVTPRGVITIHLYMRDRGYHDYIIALEKKHGL